MDGKWRFPRIYRRMGTNGEVFALKRANLKLGQSFSFQFLQFSEKSSRSLRTNSFEFPFSGDWILELLQNRFYFISFFIHHPFIFLIHRESKTFYISLEGDGSLFLSLVVFAILRIHFEYRNRISGVKDRPARLRTIK